MVSRITRYENVLLALQIKHDVGQNRADSAIYVHGSASKHDPLRLFAFNAIEEGNRKKHR